MVDTKPILKYSENMQDSFEKFSEKINRIVGSPYWFVFSILLIVIWIPSGIVFGWGDTWQLIINTTTTILTFLMVSLLQTSQNKWEKHMGKDQEREKEHLRIILEELKRLEEKIDASKDKMDQI